MRRNSILMTQPYPASGSADWLKIYYRIGEGYKKRETVVIIIASEYSRLSSLSVAVHGRFITRSDERQANDYHSFITIKILDKLITELTRIK